MSNMTPEVTLNRIIAAPKNSPIAVFKSDKPGCVDAMFASTIVSQQRIESGVGLIGVFDKKSKAKEVYATLKNNAAPVES
jgi:hypothetical protein|tara:strand:- start:376 stop:615 length:240 start_codon:yes stop_codon:yes gene_type:complete